MNKFIFELLKDVSETFLENWLTEMVNKRSDKKIIEEIDSYIGEKINNYIKDPYEKEKIQQFITQNPKVLEYNYYFISDIEKQEFIDSFFEKNGRSYIGEDENTKKCLELYLEKINSLLNKHLSLDAKVIINRIDVSTDLILEKVTNLKENIKNSNVPKVYKNYNIPPKMECFLGREEIINKIYFSFENTNLIFITGLGGIGKSQIAKEFVYRSENVYNLILWLSASTEDKLLYEYKKASFYYKLIQDDTSHDLARIKLAAFLEEFKKVLIIIDGADDISMSYWSENVLSSNSFILVTTQNSNIDCDEFTFFTVQNFSNEESEEFLLEHSSRREKCESDYEDVKELANLLQNYPLALEYARSYVNKNQISYKKYIKECLNDKNKFDIYTKHCSSYKDAAYTAWKKSFEKILEKNTNSKSILYICSFLAPNNIPFRELFSNNELYRFSEIELGNIIDAITSYSFIILKDGFANMHSITQEFIRYRIMQEASFNLYFEKALITLTNIIPDEITSFSDQSLLNQILDHAIYLMSYKSGFDKEKILDFSYKVVCKLYGFGRYMDIIYFVENKIELFDYIEYLFKMAMIKKLLIQSYHYTGNDRKSFENLYIMTTILTNSNHISENEKLYLYFEYKNLEGIIQKDCGNLEHSLELYKEAYHYLEMLGNLGDNRQRVNVLINIGNIYKKKGEYFFALEYYKEACTIADGNQDQQVRILGSIGHIYMSIGEYSLAMDYFKDTLEISKNIGDHRNESIVLNHMGYCHYNVGQYEKAKTFFYESMEITEKIDFILGKIHNLIGLAMIEQERENYLQAEMYWSSVLDLSQKINFQKGIFQSREELYKIQCQTSPD